MTQDLGFDKLLTVFRLYRYKNEKIQTHIVRLVKRFYIKNFVTPQEMLNESDIPNSFSLHTCMNDIK